MGGLQPVFKLFGVLFFNLYLPSVRVPIQRASQRKLIVINTILQMSQIPTQHEKGDSLKSMKTSIRANILFFSLALKIIDCAVSDY